MPAPQPSSSVADFVAYDQWVVARVEADPKTVQHAPQLDVPHTLLMDDVAARNKAGNIVLKVWAKRDYARDTVLDTLEPLSLKSAAHFGSKTAPGHMRIFVLTPSQYANLPRRDLPKALGELKAALNDAETPKEVQKAATEFLLKLAALVAADEVLVNAQAVYKKSVDKVNGAKIACLEGSAKLRAALGLQFPRKPKLVARYFPPVESKSKNKAAAPEPDPGPNPDPK